MNGDDIMKQKYEAPAITLLEFRLEEIMDNSGITPGDNDGSWLPGWNG